MPEPMKPDWAELVREHLALPCTEDVVFELASHLEEIYGGACARGTSDTEALRIALEQVDDWQALTLAAGICKPHCGKPIDISTW